MGRHEAGVSERRHVDVDPQVDRGRDAERARHLGDALQLIDGVDDERPDARLNGAADLVAGLGDAVEDDLPRREADPLSLPELAPRIDLDVDAGAAHLVEEPEVRAGLAGKEDLGVGVPAGEGLDHGAHVPPEAPRREQKERRRDPPGEIDDVDPVEHEVAALHRDVFVENHRARLTRSSWPDRAVRLYCLRPARLPRRSHDAYGTRHPRCPTFRRHLRRHAARLLEALVSRLPVGQAHAGTTGRHVPSAYPRSRCHRPRGQDARRAAAGARHRARGCDQGRRRRAGRRADAARGRLRRPGRLSPARSGATGRACAGAAHSAAGAAAPRSGRRGAGRRSRPALRPGDRRGAR